MHILTHNINLVKYFLVQKGNKMKIKTTVETDLSYLDILTKLKEYIGSDTCMLKTDRDKAKKLTQELFALLWKYSY